MNVRFLPTGAVAACVVMLALSSGCSHLPWHGIGSTQPSADWCADATLFAMHAVRSYELGMSYADIDRDLDASDVSYLQLYPALSVADMHRLLTDVSTHKRSRFTAAQAVVQRCEARGLRAPSGPAPAYLATPRSAAWCGQATDFAMGMAGYRDIGFTEPQMEASQHNNPRWLDEIFPALNTPDRVALVRIVYERQWSRFAAAAGLSQACKPSPTSTTPS